MGEGGTRRVPAPFFSLRKKLQEMTQTPREEAIGPSRAQTEQLYSICCRSWGADRKLGPGLNPGMTALDQEEHFFFFFFFASLSKVRRGQERKESVFFPHFAVSDKGTFVLKASF